MNNTTSTSSSNPGGTQRIIVGIASLVPTVLGLLGLRSQFVGLGYNPVGAIIGLVGATVAIFCWWFALRGQFAESRVRMRFSALGGLLFGLIGFAAGFFGPMILKPSANQGPLLGLFITGPLGFMVGAVIGWLYARHRERRSSCPPKL